MVHSSAFRALSVLITLLLIAAVSTLVVLTLRNQPTVTIQPIPTPSPTTTPTVTATPFQTLGADLIVPEGGYRFQPLLGYEVTMQGATVTLTRVLSATVEVGTTATEDALNRSASTIGLDTRTFADLGFRSNQALEDLIVQVAQPFVSQTNAEVGAVEPVTLGGSDGVVLSLRGELDGEPIVGRIVVSRRDEDRLFIAAATAPAHVWADETSAALDSVLQSIAFFEPIVAAVEPTPSPPQQRSDAERMPMQTPAATTPVTSPTAPTAVTLAATPENTQASTPAPTLIQVELAESIVLLTPTPVLSATPTTTLTTLLAPTPTPTSRGTTQPWTVVSDGNWMNELVVAGNTIWIASDGGALAWTRGSATPVKFTSINGLTDNRLTAVADCALPELGILFGSNDGLQVVDPRAGGWRQLNSRNSELSYDDISALLCDAEAGYLVIGYARHGIDVFDARTSEWRHLDRNSGLASNNVLDLAVVGALAEIWVAADDGITLAAGPDSTFYNATNSPLESNRIGAIAADPAGGVWVGGDGVLYRIDGERWTIFSAEEVEDDGFPVRLITGLALTDDGDLWLGDIDGAVCRFNPDTATCDEAFRAENGMADAPLTHLSLDADGQVYFTTAGDGFSAYDGTAWKRFFRANEGVLGNSVGAATVDPDGALWVVTDGGVQRIVAPNRPPVLTPDGGIDPATIRAIYAARNGDIWVGGDGVGVWDGERWTRYTADDGLAGTTVQAIAEDSRGRIWLGADAGVSIWNGASFFNLTRDAGLPSDDIRALLADGDAMWIGSAGGGLYRFVRNQLEVFTMDNINLPSDTITALSVGDDELLYVGTDAGLAELRTGLATSIPEIGERAVTQVLALDDSIWVGTADDGLFYDAGDGWQQETTAGALPSDRVTALASVDGAVWVGGDTGGLVRYLLPTKE